MFIPHGQNLALGDSNIEHIILFVFWFSVSRIRFKPPKSLYTICLYKLVIM